MLSLELASLGELGIDLSQLGYTMDDLNALQVCSDAQTIPEAPPGDFDNPENKLSQLDHECPACKYEWSGSCR